MAEKKLPKVVYVAWDDIDGDPYLSAEQVIDDLAIRGEKRIVGVYELKELQEIILEVKSTVKTRLVK
jgi:hypothetical protein